MNFGGGWGKIDSSRIRYLSKLAICNTTNLKP